MREKYETRIAQPEAIEDILHAGAARARALAGPFLDKLRYAAGLRDLRVQAGAAKSVESSKAEKPALQPVVFREADAFAFKVLDAKRNVLKTQGGFADAKAAMAAAREAMGALEAVG